MDRRDNLRIETALSVTCRVPASPQSATVRDISATGCRVTFRQHFNIPEGSTIHVDFGLGRVVSGRAVRSTVMVCGVRFDRRLPTRLAIELGLTEGPVQIVHSPREEIKRLHPEPVQTLPHWLRRIIGKAAERVWP